MLAFQLYMLFAVTTGITSVYELLMPVVEKREADGIVHNKYTIYATFLILAILTAPLVFLSCIVPSIGIVFREHLDTGLFGKD